MPYDPSVADDLRSAWRFECEGRSEDAIAALNRGLERSPRASTLLEVRGALYAKLEFRRAAQRDFEIATWISPGRARAWAALGQVRQELGLPRAALEALARSRRLKLECPRLDLSSARALRRLGRWRDAAVSYGRALAGLDAPELELLIEAASLVEDRPIAPDALERACAACGVSPDAGASLRAFLGDGWRPSVPGLNAMPGERRDSSRPACAADLLQQLELSRKQLARWTQLALVAVYLDDPRPGEVPSSDAIAFAPEASR